MSKRILLIRHAKSDSSNPQLDDHERPLNERGRRDAPFMARKWLEKNSKPDVLVSSTALRALNTAQYFAEGWKYPDHKILRNKELYLATPRTWLRWVRDLQDSWHFVAAFGHNEGISEFAQMLTGNENIGSMPTCAGALISFNIESWKDVVPGLGILEAYEYPKKYL